MADTKYGNLVKKMNIRATNREKGGNADYISGFGGDTLEGLNLNFTWAIHNALGDWHDGQDPHVHTYDEVLLFVGLDSSKPDYLGAEIELYLGEEGEKHIVDEPAVVVLPANLVHGPFITTKVDQPYGFSAICLNATHATQWIGKPQVTDH
ncbi:MAG: hypothetical protein JW712_11585 [Dehalococcoidales bacterium]|nr:hypothetical protein [Dehalococcoidales bacterium]